MKNEEQVTKSPSLSEVQLKYCCKKPMDNYPVISSPGEAENILRDIWDEDTIQLKEEFVVLLLNNAKKCLGWSKISSGGATATIVDPAAVLQVAILSNAQSIILAHNHPSGNLSPSQADKKLTDRIKKSGNLLGIQVDDHILLTTDSYVSFREEGIL